MPGETFSLVGESGCGKTTLGRTLVQLTPSTDGRVVFDGYELADVDPDDMRPLRRRMQIIFQDPFGSLNPRMPVSDLIGEGLLSQGLTDRNARDKRVEDALELVGLRREYSRRYPHEFSGGQRQRIGVARALALGPRLHRRGRAGLRARRVDPEPGPQPAARPQARPQPDLPVHQPQPVGRPVLLGPGRGHVPRQDRRDRDRRAAVPGPAPPVHGGAPVGHPRRGPAPPQEAPRAQGRRAVAGRAALGLPVPHPVLAARAAGQPGELRDDRAAARRSSASRPATASPATGRTRSASRPWPRPRRRRPAIVAAAVEDE